MEFAPDVPNDSARIRKITGGKDRDSLHAKTGRNLLSGLEGSDTLSGSVGSDTLLGGRGNDLFRVPWVAGSVDWVDGGKGSDILSLNFMNSPHAIEVKFAGAKLDAQNSVGLPNFINIEAFGRITGTRKNDLFLGAGTRQLVGGHLGNDTIIGGGGRDTLAGERGQDFLLGGAGDDLMDAGGQNDIVSGEGGKDRIRGGKGDDLINGNASLDFLSGATGDDSLFGGDGNDWIHAKDGNDSVDAGSGADKIWSENLDQIDGGPGRDTIIYTSGIGARIQGGSGSDELYLDLHHSRAGLHLVGVADGNEMDFTGGSFRVDGIESLKFLASGSGDDKIKLLGDSDTYLTSNDGNDRISTGDGADSIEVGGGRNHVFAGGGDDIVGVEFESTRSGAVDSFGTSRDIHRIETIFQEINEQEAKELETLWDKYWVPQPGGSLISGGTITITGPIVVNPGVIITNPIDWNVDEFFPNRHVEDRRGRNAIGSPLLDRPRLAMNLFDGGNGDDSLYGGAENSRISGGSGNDLIVGGKSYDTLIGGDGEDRMTGGDWSDLYYVDNRKDRVMEESNDGVRDTVESSIPCTLPANVECLRLAAGAGSGTGNAQKNVLIASDKGDSLTGGAGNDLLVGGNGNDTLLGSNREIRGRNEIDRMVGGKGSDLFVLGDSRSQYYVQPGDEFVRILDFEKGVDRLQMFKSADLYEVGNLQPNGATLYYFPEGEETREYMAVIRSEGGFTQADFLDAAVFV